MPDHQRKLSSVIITGAGSGIGRACASRFAQAGCGVLLCDIVEADGQASCDAIRAAGGDAAFQRVDVTDPAQCQVACSQAQQRWGQVDMLVANAGTQLGGSLLEASEADWDSILGVNLKGVAHMCQAVLPVMIERGHGSLVLVSSVNALQGSPGMAIYDASKSAVLGLMRSLAAEHGAQGIRVNAVCPGNTLTDFHLKRMAEQGVSEEQLREMTRGYALLGRAAEPLEIANAIYFLASEQASFITGHALCVDGGFTAGRTG